MCSSAATPTSTTMTTETETPCRRRPMRSSENSSFHHTSMATISTTATEAPAHRRSKRSSSSSPKASSSSLPTWVILNRTGARRENVPGDRTTSAVTHTSTGDEVSVSFHLAQPPGTSLLTVDCPQGPARTNPEVIAADGALVLFDMPVLPGADLAVDYFVYEATCHRSSLSLLPAFYPKRDSSSPGRPMQHIMSMEATGILHLSKGSFIMAELSTRELASPSTVGMYLFLSESNEWKFFKRLRVRCANNGDDDELDFSLWSIDRVVPLRSHFLIWVDYYKGMVVMDTTKQLPWRKPHLRFVPLPVGTVGCDEDDWNYGRRCPEAYRTMCVTRSGIRFVTVNNRQPHQQQQRSNFRINTWSLCDDDYTWREEASLDAEELWGLDSENRFPDAVVPEFPVVNVENPDNIWFSLNEVIHTFGDSAKTWMIEVDMKKKVLLAVTCYEGRFPSDEDTIKSARMMSRGFSFISSEMPRYLPGVDACKKRRQ